MLAFFGLGGLTAQSAQASTSIVLSSAIGAGAAAMASVYWMICGLRSLRAEGTVRIQAR